MQYALTMAKTGVDTRPSVRLAKNRQRVIDRLASAHTHNIRVFGSIARGGDNPGSDVDLLHDGDDETSIYGLTAARLELQELKGCKTDLVAANRVPDRKRRILDEAVAL